MFCPTCGKTIPDHSAFCMHCGGRTDSPARPPAESETEDFEWAFPEFTTGWRLTGFYSEADARLDIWQRFQANITAEVQKRLDEGWEPVGEVGPAAIKLRYYDRREHSEVGLMDVVFWLLTFGLVFLFWALDTTKWTYVVPTEFHVSLHRPKAQSL